MSSMILKNVKLDQYTSWLVGGSADEMVFPTTMAELKSVFVYANDQKLPITLLGGGSNVLVSDKGIRGLTVCLRRFSQINHEIKNDRLHISALSGTAKSEILKVFLKYKLAPALFLAGLPGDIGGGVVMNAGVSETMKPREFMDIVDRITTMNFDGQERTFEKADLDIQYRHTHGWQPGVVTSVDISWPLDVDDSIIDKVRQANKLRLSKQPLDLPSCGSVFKNPLPHTAGRLIEESGLKGFQIGGAQVSLKHANFIVNLGQASAQDIWSVILHVQKVVKEKTGVSLTTEVVKLGEW